MQEMRAIESSQIGLVISIGFFPTTNPVSEQREGTTNSLGQENQSAFTTRRIGERERRLRHNELLSAV